MYIASVEEKQDDVMNLNVSFICFVSAIFFVRRGGRGWLGSCILDDLLLNITSSCKQTHALVTCVRSLVI